MRKTIQKLIFPKAKNEDSKRKEFILNILLVSSIVLFVFGILVNIFVSIARPDSHAESSVGLMFLIFILGFFITLYKISRKGYPNISAYIFIGIFLVLAVFMSIKWGVDVNASLLLYALTIIMSSILISTKFSFVITGVITFCMFFINHIHTNDILSVNQYWRTEPWKNSDTIMTIIIFLSIATISWLSNKEIEKSLLRARKSEKILQEERDMLEVTVEKRTKELREAESEKVAQLYRFAEFGRLSSGLFHDLVNPLNAVSLNMEMAQNSKELGKDIEYIKKYLDQAIVSSKRMENFIQAVRKQISKETEEKYFSIEENILQVLDILSYKAHANSVILKPNLKSDVQIFGDEMKWNQFTLNLITNAIDAYEEVESDKKEVLIATNIKNAELIFSVTDYGMGIPKENLQKIFEPFFSTKKEIETKGTGIGLSMTKDIIEKNFKGKISVQSDITKGTSFVVSIPIAPQLNSKNT
ncbi:MAG: GHKL domain-containing protein [Candidatus Pacebacteria bacterium]|nr:GHKL domain-containing protein [Candidatus Paceibacterota bacterium]MCF7862700.1 GHKL domain-containing protein [Candidatus Paceibacterota bacterium]